MRPGGENGGMSSKPRSVLGRVLRDRQVLSALAAGLVIGVAAGFSAPRYPWPFALIGVVWLVATVVRLRAAAVAARGEPPAAPPAESPAQSPAESPAASPAQPEATADEGRAPQA